MAHDNSAVVTFDKLQSAVAREQKQAKSMSGAAAGGGGVDKENVNDRLVDFDEDDTYVPYEVLPRRILPIDVEDKLFARSQVLLDLVAAGLGCSAREEAQVSGAGAGGGQADQSSGAKAFNPVPRG